jgi:hypothetical protein
MSMFGSSISKMVTYDVLQKQGRIPKVAQINASDIPHTISGNTVSSDFRPLQRQLGVTGDNPQPQAQPAPKKTARSTNRIAAKPRSPRMLLSNRSNAAQGLE